MRIWITSVLVDDQEKALEFYTRIGFQLKHDVPTGAHRWLTLVSKEQPEGTELLLEPGEHPAVKPYKDALVADGIPAASFQVSDLTPNMRGSRGLVSCSPLNQWMQARCVWLCSTIHAVT